MAPKPPPPPPEPPKPDWAGLATKGAAALLAAGAGTAVVRALLGRPRRSAEVAVGGFEEAPTGRCLHCGRAGTPGRNLLACRRCLDALYCSESCHVASWPTHRQTCKPPEEVRAAAEAAERAAEEAARGAVIKEERLREPPPADLAPPPPPQPTLEDVWASCAAALESVLATKHGEALPDLVEASEAARVVCGADSLLVAFFELKQAELLLHPGYVGQLNVKARWEEGYARWWAAVQLLLRRGLEVHTDLAASGPAASVWGQRGGRVHCPGLPVARAEEEECVVRWHSGARKWRGLGALSEAKARAVGRGMPHELTVQAAYVGLILLCAVHWRAPFRFPSEEGRLTAQGTVLAALDAIAHSSDALPLLHPERQLSTAVASLLGGGRSSSYAQSSGGDSAGSSRLNSGRLNQGDIDAAGARSGSATPRGGPPVNASAAAATLDPRFRAALTKRWRGQDVVAALRRRDSMHSRPPTPAESRRGGW